MILQTLQWTLQRHMSCRECLLVFPPLSAVVCGLQWFCSCTTPGAGQNALSDGGTECPQPLMRFPHGLVEIAGPGGVITIGNITQAALKHVKGFMLSSVPAAWKAKKQSGMWNMASQAIPLLDHGDHCMLAHIPSK